MTTTMVRHTAAPATEADQRLAILNSFLTTPHRKLAEFLPIHAQIRDTDPIFYRQLAAWYSRKGEIRDHQEAFIISLCLDTFDGNRDIGLALLRDLPPYRVMRVVDQIVGSTRRVKVKDAAYDTACKAYGKLVQAARKPILEAAGIVLPKAPKEAKAAKKGNSGKDTQPRRPKIKLPAEVKARIAEAIKDIPRPIPTYKEETSGLYRNAPNSLKTEITRYLREREAEPDWFDATALTSRHHLQRLYRVFHIKPSDRAREIIFENKMPAGSVMAKLRDLSKLSDPIEQARAILDNKIPYRLAATVVADMSPTVILALVEVMSPQELINNLGSLKTRGAFENPDIKASIDAKLEKAKKGKNVAALKGAEAIKAAGLDEETVKAVQAVGDAQVKRRGTIKHRVALLIDKSASMHVSIEVGKQIGAMVSAVADSDLYCYVFDNMPMPIKSAGKTLADWEKALKGINPGGGTSCGVAVDMMRRQKQVVDQIIIVTDGGENQNPRFPKAYNDYCRDLSVTPSVVMVKVAGGDIDTMSAATKAANIDMDVWPFAGDYYSLPGLIPILTKTSKMDLLMDIMQWRLPIRKSA